MKTTNSRLMAGAALAVVLAAGAGFGLAKCTGTPAATAPAAEAEAKPKGAADAVAMTGDRITSAGISVEPVSVGGLNAEIVAPATIMAAPDGQAVLTARASGAVTRIFKRLGDPVRQGETVAVVESRDAAAISADRRSAAAKATLAQKTLERERYLYGQKVSPRQDLEQAQAEAASAQAEAQRAQLAASAAHVSSDGRSVLVTSPISGRITSAAASLGAFVQSEAELFRVADPTRIQVEVAVTALDANRLAPGDRATLEVNGAQIDAEVRAVTPTLNAETRSATVVLSVANPATLQPGAVGRARLRPKAASASTAIVIPEDAVQTVDGRDAVFVRTSQGFKAVPVTLGQRGAGRVEVVSGLSAAAQIAVKNSFLLKAELGKGTEEE